VPGSKSVARFNQSAITKLDFFVRRARTIAIDYQLGSNYQDPGFAVAGRPLGASILRDNRSWKGEPERRLKKRKNPSPDNNDHERERARTSGVTFASRGRQTATGPCGTNITVGS